MIFIKKITSLIFFLLLPGLFIFSCAKIDPVTGEKILIEQDPRKKARDFADKDGGILGGIGIGNAVLEYPLAALVGCVGGLG